ncbi:MAG: molybdate ABC transporter substrate-binding protein [Mesorhizobium sp.]|nr:molybdate ABC transporter substrate-binding protein [Mesorhizobium sp.]
MFREFRVRLAGSLLLAIGLFSTTASAQEDAPVVAAAANLQFAIEEIAKSFAADTGKEVRLSMGSTGNIARQIRQGAPFELFLAADEKTLLDLAADGLTRDEGTVYAVGRIVVITPNGSKLAADGSLGSLREALAGGTLGRFAIANPEHAPFGVAAREALTHEGLWDAIQPHIVLGENVSQATQFALSGNTDGGIIAYSLALAPSNRERGTFELVPEEWHEPLRQRMALLKNAGPVAEAFYEYMDQPTAREILERYGFSPPKGQ